MAYAIDELDLLNDVGIARLRRPAGIASLDQDYPAVQGQARRRPIPGIAERAIGAGIAAPPASSASRPNQRAPLGVGAGIEDAAQNQREINRLPAPNAYNAMQRVSPVERSAMADQAIANVDRIAGAGGSVEAPARYTQSTPVTTAGRNTYAIGQEGIGQPFGARMDNGFSAPDVANINARIRGIRDNPQAIGEFNRAQQANRTGITLSNEGGTPTFTGGQGVPSIADNLPGTQGAPSGVTPQDYQAGIARAAADRTELAGIESRNNIANLIRQATDPIMGSSLAMRRQSAASRAAGKVGLEVEMKQRDTESRRIRSEFTGRHLDRRQTEVERHNRTTEDMRGVSPDTSLMKNAAWMVKNGIAKDEADAHNKLRTAMGKSDEDAILSLVGSLMRGTSYFGKNGYEKAVRDATAMVQSVRGPQGQNQRAGVGSYSVRGKTFTDADIEYTARQNNMTPDQVKQRLGIR